MTVIVAADRSTCYTRRVYTYASAAIKGQVVLGLIFECSEIIDQVSRPTSYFHKREKVRTPSCLCDELRNADNPKGAQSPVWGTSLRSSSTSALTPYPSQQILRPTRRDVARTYGSRPRTQCRDLVAFHLACRPGPLSQCTKTTLYMNSAATCISERAR